MKYFHQFFSDGEVYSLLLHLFFSVGDDEAGADSPAFICENVVEGFGGRALPSPHQGSRETRGEGVPI